MDLVAQVERMPLPGETVFGTEVSQIPGGKGANQAVAAARLGQNTAMIGALGDDSFADALRQFLEAESLDISGLRYVNGASGTAIITLDAGGENAIVVVPGANDQLSAEQLQTVTFSAGDVLLLQNEIPDAVNMQAAKLARAGGAAVVYNTAPYRPLGDMAQHVDYLVANETEFAQLVGDYPEGMTPERVAEQLGQGVLAGTDVIVTVGADGIIARIAGEIVRVAGHTVTVRDTTGAGDCFCGALAAALARGNEPARALPFANAAAALSVQRLGASSGMPSLAEVEAFETFLDSHSSSA